MQIKSDKTPKKDLLEKLLKKNKTSEILKTVMFGTGILSLLIAAFYILNVIITDTENIQKERDNKNIEKINEFHPPIKCSMKFYLPDEYILGETNGIPSVSIFNAPYTEDTEYYLSKCSLVQKEITDSFREAIYKKRGKTDKPIPEPIEEPIPEKVIEIQSKVVPTILDNNETNLTTLSFKDSLKENSMQTDTYYQKLEYAQGYPKLVKATSELETYKLTEEYKTLKKFERTQKLNDLNRNLNTIRPTMWKLHYRFGNAEGTFEDLQSGKLSVKMLEGTLYWSTSF